jgi:hypothetical protein
MFTTAFELAKLAAGADVIRPRDDMAGRRTIGSMRTLLLIASGLVFLAGAPLVLVPDQTARFFAWTIQPPMTAAFLGGSYWAACVFELLSSRERVWARARLAIPAVLVFTVLTLIVTLVHISRFHFDFPFTDPDARPADTFTVIGTWFWLAIYAFVPLAMGLVLVRQVRTPGVDPTPVAPLGRVARSVIVAQAVLIAPLGMALLLMPLAAAPLWPWKLTALTARAVGAWLIGLSLTGIQALYENDRTRLGPAGIAAIVWGTLELLFIARFASTIDWTRPSAWIYAAFVASVIGIGAAAYAGSRRSAASG